jgi:hypothetical protein
LLVEPKRGKFHTFRNRIKGSFQFVQKERRRRQKHGKAKKFRTRNHKTDTRIRKPQKRGKTI